MADVALFSDDFWREEINKIEAIDDIPNKDTVDSPAISFSNDTQVEVQRLTTIMYVFTTVEGRKKFSHNASMKQESLGTMGYDEAKALSKKRG